MRFETSFLRALQKAAHDDAECAPFIHTNDTPCDTAEVDDPFDRLVDMPPTEVTTPDGRVLVVEAPAGTKVVERVPRKRLRRIGPRAKDEAIASILTRKAPHLSTTAVQWHHAKELLLKRGKWRGIALASNDGAHPACNDAFALVTLAEDVRMRADFTDPVAAPCLPQLVMAGLLDDADARALHALCFVPITAEEVSRAVRGPWGDEEA